jgi:hypothetical protein
MHRPAHSENPEEHGSFLREEMLAAAVMKKYDDKGGYVNGSEALERLAKVDWKPTTSSRSFLERFAIVSKIAQYVERILP